MNCENEALDENQVYHIISQLNTININIFIQWFDFINFGVKLDIYNKIQ